MLRLLEGLGAYVLGALEEMGQIMTMFLSAIAWAVRPPWRIRAVFKEMEFVGVGSIFVVILTGGFTGGVFTLQSFYGFSQFGAESMVGPTVALAMTRELGPVLTGLMVTGRAGSAMAAELGTMRVTEQIDALYVMAANPIKYLIVPRMLAGIVMLPLLTGVANFVGVVGGYLVAVHILGLSHGVYLGRIIEVVRVDDLFNGLIKAGIFGAILSVIGCYKGFYTKGGAEGVGRSTTEAVVLASVLILLSDYFLTAIMF
jgi:phospholipid/cholesterol/gamma-HCH transport system permease protein